MDWKILEGRTIERVVTLSEACVALLYDGGGVVAGVDYGYEPGDACLDLEDIKELTYDDDRLAVGLMSQVEYDDKHAKKAEEARHRQEQQDRVKYEELRKRFGG